MVYSPTMRQPRFLTARVGAAFILAALPALLWCGGASAAAGSPARPAATAATVVVPPGWPQTVSVPRLAVVAHVEPVTMKNPIDTEAPHSMDDVAWYELGHRPGERGRAELFGHLDSTCCPAIFYHLNAMRAGDLVQVRYRNGPPLTFRVRWQATYPRLQMPLRFMYGPTIDHGLMLVTCAGIFHRDGTGYDHRLMVYATLVG